jgi:aldehyde dehydrogenase (NAD+)
MQKMVNNGSPEASTHYVEVANSSGRSPLRRYRNYIGGKWCEPGSGEWLDSLNPATAEVWALIPRGNKADAERAVSAAREAFEAPEWRNMTPTRRGEILRAIGTLLEARIEELATLESTDNGKRITEVIPQLKSLPKYFHYFAGLADKIQGAVIPVESPEVLNYTRHEPLGVVVAITPWNSPLMLAIWKIAPALAAGNTVIVKPSEHASVSTLELARLIDEAGLLPPGVLNVVAGLGAEVGEPLVRHPDVAKITFTGSEVGGQHIASAASADVKRVTLELGGKSPQLVFEDANIDDAVNGVIAGIFGSLGQSCVAGSRLIVHQSLHDRFVEKLVDAMRDIRVGDQLDPSTQIGPVATRQQYEKVLSFIANAKAAGARCVLGGEALKPLNTGNGWFVAPTIFTGVRSDMELFREEVFGPVLAVLPFQDETQAIALANDTKYGLAAGVWTRDVARALRASEQIAAGTVYINTYRNVSMASPVGGYKRSGYGRENGIEAIHEFLQVKSVWLGLGATRNPFPRQS